MHILKHRLKYRFQVILFIVEFQKTSPVLSPQVFMFITVRQRSCRKVMFSHVSVILLGGGPMWPLPMMHWISLFRALSVLAPPLEMGPPWPWPTCWWHLVSSLETSWTSMYKALPPMVLISGGRKSTYGWLLLFCVCNTLADPRGGGDSDISSSILSISMQFSGESV